MKIVKEDDSKNLTLETEEIKFDDLSNISSNTCKSILKLLSKESNYPKQIAKDLKLHEQNVYYYIRKLEKAGFIEIERSENINGTFANFYKLKSDSFYLKLGDFKESAKIHEKESNYLKPFIEHGELNSIIVVGSPDPHGPLRARARDGYFGMDLALFLGSFLNYIPESKVRLDTEVTERELRENNLIVIGGPFVNKISEEINSKMQIYFDSEEKMVKSKISGKSYHSEETGYINKLKSPYNDEKMIISVAGLRNTGTKSAILGFLKKFDELRKGNLNNRKIHSRIVEGIDLDSDGRVDDVEFLE